MDKFVFCSQVSQERKYIVWILNKERSLLLDYGFIYDEYNMRYTQDPNLFDYGGEVYINDGEDFFRIGQFCMELEDDAYFSSEHILDREDNFSIIKLIENNVVMWKN